MELKWSNLRIIAEQKFQTVPDNSGIYFVRWAKSGKPVVIDRLDGSDSQGILYVGSAKNLKRRIKKLWRGIHGANMGIATAHTISKTIIFCRTSEIIKPDDYEIIWKELKTHEEALGQEWAALRSYAESHKEPPPLNLGIRREFFAIWGLAKWGKSHWAYERDEFVKSIIGS